MGTCSSFCELSTGANWACGEDVCLMAEFGDTGDIFVGIMKAFTTWVSNALVPQELLCLRFNSIDGDNSIHH